MNGALLYAANENTQAYVAAGTVIDFGETVRRHGNNIILSGGNVEVEGAGFYSGIVNLSFTGAAGTATIQVYKNGVPIRGARVIRTTVADTSFVAAIPFAIRDKCCCGDVITVGISGVAGNVTNAAILTVKD